MMPKNNFLRQISRSVLRKYGTKRKPSVIPEQSVITEIDNEVYKPRRHPGIIKPRTATVPDSAIKAIINVTQDYPVKALVQDSKVLCRHLQGKLPPVEKNEMKKASQEVQDKVVSKLEKFEIKTEQDQMRYKQIVRNKVTDILKKKVYHWKPVSYDMYNSLAYLIGRFAPEYAVLTRIFAEIAMRDPEFQPKSLFDFGSGIGTVTWAANAYWKKHIFEYFNVDSSVNMNDLAQILLQGGKGTKQMSLKGVFYRQFLPASNTAYDLVVSAYSLLELPSRQSRLETILNLWNKTQNYLVVVEQGTNAGFKVINEVRDFILDTRNKTKGHLFSPCPHDDVCPRFQLNDETPCNFQMGYFSLPVGEVSEARKERYSYVVIKKGERSPSDPQWPRVVRDTLVRSRHSICRMCTKNGKLEEVIFTASKHGKTMYHCARSTQWGDLLPIKVENVQSEDGEF